MSSASSTKLYDESCLKGFTILFSWNYPNDWCQKNVEDEIFHVYDVCDVLRLESQVITDSIQASNYGVILSQPNPEQGSIPCELQIVSQAIPNEYTISKLIIVSEAKHLELYVNDMYIKTSKGFMLTLKKGSTPSLFQSEFDFAPFTHNADKVALKFVSLPSNNSMRLQTVVILLSRMPQPKSIILDDIKHNFNFIFKKNSSTVDIKGIREMLQEMGLKVPENAENLMNEIEMKQNREKCNQQVILKQMCNQGSMLQMLTSIQNNQFDEQHSSPTFYQHQQASQGSSFQGLIRQTKTNSSSRSLHSLYPISRDAVEPDLHTLTDRGSLSQRASLYEPKNNLSRAEIYNSFGTVHNSTNLHISMDRGSLSERTSFHQPVKSPPREEFYNGFGTPNPPQESVLANALLNQEASKVTAYSRASYIEQDNYEKSQLKLIKELLMDQSEHSKPSRFTHRPQHSQKNNRPKSLSALPSEKEADFTKMLTSLLEDSGTSKTQNRSQEQLSADRWEAYLRSRVRASQRLSTNVMTSEEAPLERDDSNRNDGQSIHVPNQPKCTLCDSSIQKTIIEHIQASENRITQLLINKMAELRCDMMSKMDNICNAIVMDKTHYSSSHYDDNFSDVLKSVV